MLDKTYDWEKLVHPTPTDEMVTIRKAIVTAFISIFDTNKDIGWISQLVGAAIIGLKQNIQTDVDFAHELAEIAREHRAAYPTSLIDNAQDLQLSASIAIGELLTRKSTKGRWLEAHSLLASLVVSASLIRPNSNGHHLSTILQDLQAHAEDLLSRGAIAERIRPELDLEWFENMSVPDDVPTFWNALKPILSKSLSAIVNASAIDRDELEVLWWIYNEKSTTFTKPISELDVFDIALVAPMELVDRGLCPAPASLRGIVYGLIASAQTRNASSSKAKSLKSLVPTWPIEVISTLAPDDEDVTAHILNIPKLLPLTWIATKVKATGVATGWEPEFEARTGAKSSQKLLPKTLADQVFSERTAQHLLLEISGD